MIMLETRLISIGSNPIKVVVVLVVIQKLKAKTFLIQKIFSPKKFGLK